MLPNTQMFHSIFGGLLLSAVCGIDVPFGVYTPEQIEAFENMEFNSSFSTKTPPSAALGEHEPDVLTFVLDFKEPGSPVTSDIFNNEITSFDVTAYGFDAADFALVAQSILDSVITDYFTELVGTVAGPPSQDLAIDFIIGEIGTAPPGVTEFYFIQIGSGDGTTPLGVAGGSVVRNADGDGPNFSIETGDVVGSVFTDQIVSIGSLTPSDALTTGNLALTTFAVAGTTSHEIGHAVSLLHIDPDAITPMGLSPIMGTGATGLPNQARIGNREFSLSGNNEQAGDATQFHIPQLVSAIGLHSTTSMPSSAPSSAPTRVPSSTPSSAPTRLPSSEPTSAPSSSPTDVFMASSNFFMNNPSLVSALLVGAAAVSAILLRVMPF